MKKRITRKDVAKHAGVSVAVVSYVVNNGPKPVSEKSKAAVLAAIKELGYYPNEVARSLRIRQSLSIGLILPTLKNPVYGEVAIGVQNFFVPKGYLVLLGNSASNPDQENKLVRMFRSKQVDGVIIHPAEKPDKLIEMLSIAGIPCVVMQNELAKSSYIVLDDVAGGSLATRHLISLGHRRIGIISGQDQDAARSKERLNGYKLELQAAGIPFDQDLVKIIRIEQAAAIEATVQLLQLQKKPTAIFAHNDYLAMGVMYAVRKYGLCIPEDISIVGYDNLEYSEYLYPSLTTIGYSTMDMGRQAAEMLFNKINNTDKDFKIIQTLPVNLIVRNSTAPKK